MILLLLLLLLIIIMRMHPPFPLVLQLMHPLRKRDDAVMGSSYTSSLKCKVIYFCDSFICLRFKKKLAFDSEIVLQN